MRVDEAKENARYVESGTKFLLTPVEKTSALRRPFDVTVLFAIGLFN